MKLSDAEKLNILLNQLNAASGQIDRRQHNEDKIFEWAITTLLAVFGVVLALSGSGYTFSNLVAVKIIASFLVIIPTIIFIVRVLSERKSIARQGIVIDRIRNELNFLKKGYYIKDEYLLPDEWHGSLSKSLRKRKTPYIYAIILTVLLVGVVTTIWMIL
ncbi:MAG: hypothetical protein HN855_01030 [Anaerolineae bacterium]|jgi:hypothetical protein|nr:hypothetical protein [Anaerolineae bacterium]MBT7069582.1 hypothetical protein [Anaerolineae bacterium]MBT7323724.1 hypothetical protein [Anaerolineae bacterium]